MNRIRGHGFTSRRAPGPAGPDAGRAPYPLHSPARHVLMLGGEMMAHEMKVEDDQGRLYGGRRQLTLANALRLLLGLWVMDAPFVYAPLGISAATVWNDLIVGGCVV